MLSSDFSLASLPGYLSPSLALSHKHPVSRSHLWTGGGLRGVKLFRLLAESVAIDEHKRTGLNSQVFIYELCGNSTEAADQIISRKRVDEKF